MYQTDVLGEYKYLILFLDEHVAVLSTGHVATIYYHKDNILLYEKK